MGTITIKVLSLVTPAIYEEIEEGLREYFKETGLSAIIECSETGNTVRITPDEKDGKENQKEYYLFQPIQVAFENQGENDGSK